MGKGSWRQSEEYRFYEDNPNTKMRPGLGKLIHKTRNLSILKDRPDSVAELIDALAYHYLVREGQHPDVLWDVISRLMFKFSKLTGGWDWHAQKIAQEYEPLIARGSLPVQAQLVDSAGGLERVGEMTEDQLAEDERLAHDKDVVFTGLSRKVENPMGYEPDDSIDYQAGYEAGYTAGRDGEAARPVSLGGALEIVLADKRLRVGVEGVLIAHHLDSHFECRCERTFDMATEWAKHVRYRVWKYLKEEFDADRSSEEAESSD